MCICSCMCVCVCVCVCVDAHSTSMQVIHVHLHESPYIVASEQVTNLHEIWNESHIMGKHSTLIFCDFISSVYESATNANL